MKQIALTMILMTVITLICCQQYHDRINPQDEDFVYKTLPRFSVLSEKLTVESLGNDEKVLFNGNVEIRLDDSTIITSESFFIVRERMEKEKYKYLEFSGNVTMTTKDVVIQARCAFSRDISEYLEFTGGVIVNEKGVNNTIKRGRYKYLFLGK